MSQFGRKLVDRPFSNEAAAWLVVAKGTNSEREWRQRKADLERAGGLTPQR